MIINIDPTTQGCEKDPGANYTCFHFQACCIIESLVKSTQTNTHKLNYVIEAETFPGGRKYSRVFFDNDKSNIVNKTIRLGKDVEDCREHIVYLKNNTRDIQTPIKVNEKIYMYIKRVMENIVVKNLPQLLPTFQRLQSLYKLVCNCQLPICIKAGILRPVLRRCRSLMSYKYK